MAELAEAVEHGAEAALTVQEYITHHLSFLTYGRHPDGDWGLAHTPEEAAEMGFWSFHVDTLGWSIFIGAAFLLFFVVLALEPQPTIPTVFKILLR